MKKILSMLLVMVMAFSFVACGNKETTDNIDKATEKPVDSNRDIVLDSSYAKQLIGKKVAVVLNLEVGDHTQQFLDGCVSEGKDFGFTVDTYVTDGDDTKTQEVVTQCISKGYDGIILSHGQLSYTYDMLKPAVDAGMKVVTFDSMPYKDGNAESKLLEGVTSTAQDDVALSELSLQYMMKEFEEAGGTYPMKVLKTFMGPGIPPLDRRNTVYTQLEADGKIETLEILVPSDTANARDEMKTKTSLILSDYVEGSVDAIWGCYDELAKGVLQALNEAGRTDIPMYTIDISNDDIQLMINNGDIWKSTAAVDPKLIGIVNMRLLAMKFVEVETPDYYRFAANNIITTHLNPEINMTNLSSVVDGWGDATSEETFNLDWMEEVRDLN